MNAPATQEQKTYAVGTSRLVLDDTSFQSIMKFAEMMAGGVSTVPKHLQKNKADCAAIIIQSMQWQMNPYAVAQKTHVVNGVLGYEAQLVNAVLISKAPLKERLQYEWFGPWEKIQGKLKEVVSQTKKDENNQPKKYMVPDWKAEDEAGIGIRVFATLEGEEKPRTLEVLMKQARTRNSTLWAEDPKQQLAYLATKKWARLHCPDVILGVYTPDELEETYEIKDITPGTTVINNTAAQPAAEPAPAINVDAVLAKIEAHTSTDALKADWANWSAQCEFEKNLEAYKTIKAAVHEKALDLKAEAAGAADAKTDQEPQPTTEKQNDLPLGETE